MYVLYGNKVKYINNFIKFLKLSYYVNICIILIYDFIKFKIILEY